MFGIAHAEEATACHGLVVHDSTIDQRHRCPGMIRVHASTRGLCHIVKYQAVLQSGPGHVTYIDASSFVGRIPMYDTVFQDRLGCMFTAQSTSPVSPLSVPAFIVTDDAVPYDRRVPSVTVDPASAPARILLDDAVFNQWGGGILDRDAIAQGVLDGESLQ